MVLDGGAEGGLQNIDPKVIAEDFLTSTVHLGGCKEPSDIICPLYSQPFDVFSSTFYLFFSHDIMAFFS